MISGFQRLPAVRAHCRFVAAIKETVRKARRSVPDPATVLPTFVGAELLDFKVPAIMEQAFGYRGNLRFVEFSYSLRTHQFGYADGEDHVPSDAQLCTEFVNHQLVWAEIGEDDCPTLYGEFQRRGGRFCRGLDRLKQERHCLLADRQERHRSLASRSHNTRIIQRYLESAGFPRRQIIDPSTQVHVAARHVDIQM